VNSRPVVFIIPGNINTDTGGYHYNRRLLSELRAGGRDVTHLALGPSYPNPTAGDASDAAEKLAKLPDNCIAIIDGLALGVLDSAVVSGLCVPFVALIHHPLASESGLNANRRDFLHATERRNLERAAHVIVPSSHTAKLLVADYGVPPSRISVAQPGVDRSHCESQQSAPPLILSVGIQVPRKGHDVLLRALAEIVDVPWQAVIAGPVMDDAYAQSLVGLRDELGLSSRVDLAGRVSGDELERLYCRASLFALATRFEGYGMVFGEAMVHGLPIVSCRTSAVPDTVPADAGILVGPDDPHSFAAALTRVLQDSNIRSSLSVGSSRMGAELPDWTETANRVGRVFDEIERSSSARNPPSSGKGNDD
jgi:glycosyltransferase involved in cell wall biosynthesis